MNDHRLNGRGPATTIDLPARRVGGAGSSVSVQVHRAGCWLILEFEGEMDLQALSLVEDLVGGDAPRVVFDLRAVTFMDARGLGLLIDVQRRVLEVGGCVRLAAPSTSVRRVLALTGCGHQFPTFDSLLRAVATPVEAGPGF